MAIPRKQIGWSQESNLLWEISRQMEKLTGVAFNSGGGGGGGVTSIIAGDGIDVDVPTGNVTVSTIVNSQLIDLTLADYTISEPGVYEVKYGTAAGGYEIIILPDPADPLVNGKTITIINSDAVSAPISSAEWVPYYQGTGTQISKLNAYSTYEFVATFNASSTSYGWHSKPTTNVITREGILLIDGVTSYNLSVGTDGGGFYVIDKANDEFGMGGVIIFPPASDYVGKRIAILNIDGTYAAYIDNNGYRPIDLDGSGLNYISAATAMEFISTGNNWYILSSRSI